MPTTHTRAPDQYFASLPPAELIKECKERVTQYVTFLQTSGRLERWQRNYANYYGSSTGSTGSSNRISSAGQNGEYTTIQVNDFRNLITHLVVLVTQGRPALKTKAANSDSQSQKETIVGDALLEYGLREQGAEKDLKRSVELALLYDESFILQLWDQFSGNPVGVDLETGTVKFDGDVAQGLYGACDVARDVTWRDSNPPWLIFRQQRIRYDLMEQFPAFKEDILKASSTEAYLPGIYTFAIPNPVTHDDYVDTYLFLHRKCAALPNGRLTLYVGEAAIIDVPLPYDEVPVGRISPAEQDQTTFGYSNGNDLLGIQEGKDTLYSIVLSNEVTFGGQNIAAKKGSGLTWNQLGAGFNLFELENPQTDINPLQLTKTAPEIFEFIQMLDKKQETLSGINSTVRGNPQENLKSGSALALVEAQAMQFIDGLQESYNQLLETWGSHRIMILQKFVDQPRVIAIVGQENRSYLQSFTYDKGSIANIRRVQVEVVSALSKTYAGKLQMAQDMIQAGVITQPDQYLTVIQTGKLEPLTNDPTKRLLMINQENEALRNGQQIPVMITDWHKDHINCHAAELDDPGVRMGSPQVVQTFQQHIMQHVQLLMQATAQNPLLLWATGQPMPPMPAGPPPPAPPKGPTPNQGVSPAQVSNPTPPVQRQAQGVNMPKQPVPPPGGPQGPGPQGA